MTLNEYQKQAMTTCTESSMNDTYLMFGLMAEVGELADKVAKAKRKEIITIESNDIYLDLKADIGDYEDFQSHFIKELGDILWFVALISKKLALHWTPSHNSTSTNSQTEQNEAR